MASFSKRTRFIFSLPQSPTKPLANLRAGKPATHEICKVLNLRSVDLVGLKLRKVRSGSREQSRRVTEAFFSACTKC